MKLISAIIQAETNGTRFLDRTICVEIAIFYASLATLYKYPLEKQWWERTAKQYRTLVQTIEKHS